MALRPITVTQLNDYIARVFDSDTLLMNVCCEGEISNLKYHSSGHVYFSINDENSKINCFLPASYVRNLSYELGDGLHVILTGKVTVYRKGGYYSLFVRSVKVSGEGDLNMAFQLMKEKLSKEGLFDPAHKKSIPAFPKKVGILTSETGAAVQDIIKIIRSRNELVDVIVFPVPVQGDGAAKVIADTLQFVNSASPDIDVLIVGRGGGSQEDLWAFNEEVLARAIFDSTIPVISAVGHEIDFSISDFVADVRAETPTAAAEMAVPDLNYFKNRLDQLKEQIYKELLSRIRYESLRVDSLIKGIHSDFERRIAEDLHKLEKLKLILEENNPLRIMEKGYSVIENIEGKVVRFKDQLTDGEYTVILSDGKVKVRIENV